MSEYKMAVLCRGQSDFGEGVTRSFWSLRVCVSCWSWCSFRRVMLPVSLPHRSSFIRVSARLCVSILCVVFCVKSINHGTMTICFSRGRFLQTPPTIQSSLCFMFPSLPPREPPLNQSHSSWALRYHARFSLIPSLTSPLSFQNGTTKVPLKDMPEMLTSWWCQVSEAAANC